MPSKVTLSTLMRFASCLDRSSLHRLLYDKSEATRLAAGTLKVEEVPAFFIWKDGKLQDEYSGTSYESLHHAVARCLGVVEDVG